jgi:5-methylcytosine-specific restriction protein A
MARRTRWLRAHPLCALCLLEGYYTRAEQVDHVIPLERGGKDDESNLQTLCLMCHDLKTRRERRQRARSLAIGIDGWPA